MLFVPIISSAPLTYEIGIVTPILQENEVSPSNPVIEAWSPDSPPLALTPSLSTSLNGSWQKPVLNLH